MKPEHSYSKYKHGDRAMYKGEEVIVMGSAWQFYGKGYSFYEYQIYYPRNDNTLAWVTEGELAAYKQAAPIADKGQDTD